MNSLGTATLQEPIEFFHELIYERRTFMEERSNSMNEEGKIRFGCHLRPETIATALHLLIEIEEPEFN